MTKSPITHKSVDMFILINCNNLTT